MALQFSSVAQSLFATPWTAACQASMTITNSQSLLKLMSIELLMLSNHLIFCCPLLLLPSIFPSIRGFFSESAVHIAAAAAKLLQLYLTLCDSIDGSPPGSPVPGVLQARTLEWGAIVFSAPSYYRHLTVTRILL